MLLNSLIPVNYLKVFSIVLILPTLPVFGVFSGNYGAVVTTQNGGDIRIELI